MRQTIFIENLDLGASRPLPALTFDLRPVLRRRRVGAAMRKRRRRVLGLRLADWSVDSRLAVASCST